MLTASQRQVSASADFAQAQSRVSAADLTRKALAASVVLLLLCVASYGLMLGSLGYYWDDWPGMFVSNFLGSHAMHDYVASDRPVTAWLFALTAPILGRDPLRAHVAALVLRWAIAFAVWWLMLGIWPGRFRSASATALLVAIYPGFSSHSIAWIHSQGIYIPMLLSLGSLAAMMWSVRVRQGLWLSCAGVFGSLASVLLVEYFVGLELLRPFLLWIVYDDRSAGFWGRVRRVAAKWWPYACVWVAWAIWRLVFFRSSRVEADQNQFLESISAHPARQLSMRLFHAASDIFQCGVGVWTQTIAPYLWNSRTSGTWLVGWLVVCAAGLLSYVLLQYFKDEPRRDSRFASQAAALGLIAMTLGGLPVWAANRGVVLGQASDRYSTPLLLGACVLLTALIQAIERYPRIGIAITSLLVGFSATFQYRTQERYANDWKQQKAFFQQLRWRAPALQPGTALLLIDDSEISPKSDYALSVPLNILYQPNDSANFSYWIFHVTENGRDGMRPPAEKAPLDGSARTLTFRGNAGASVVAWLPASGCLKLISEQPQGPYSPPLAGLLSPLSHLDRIRDVVAPRTTSLFGPRSNESWCYYYERGDLARQEGNWSLAASLGDQARKRKVHPDDPAEWLLFIEAYIHERRDFEAATLANNISQLLPPQWNPLEIATKQVANLESRGPHELAAQR